MSHSQSISPRRQARNSLEISGWTHLHCTHNIILGLLRRKQFILSLSGDLELIGLS